MGNSVNRGQEHENFNVGLVNIEDENNSSGISGWMVVEYLTFFIIILLGLRLLARCFHNCCQRLGERQQRMFTEVVTNQSRRSEMEMHVMGSRQEGSVDRSMLGDRSADLVQAPPPTYCAAAEQTNQRRFLDYDTVKIWKRGELNSQSSTGKTNGRGMCINWMWSYDC